MVCQGQHSHQIDLSRADQKPLRVLDDHAALEIILHCHAVSGCQHVLHFYSIRKMPACKLLNDRIADRDGYVIGKSQVTSFLNPNHTQYITESEYKSVLCGGSLHFMHNSF